MKALAIIRVSSEDQKHGYGPDSQWEDDILEAAPGLGLEVSKEHRISIEESATSWDRVKFTEAINRAIELYGRGEIEAVLFPRVDRETRFIFASMPLLSAMLKIGIKVYFARERLFLNPSDPEAVSRYLTKVGESQAYVATMTANLMKGRRRRVIKDGLLPTGGVNLYGYIYNKETGKRTINEFEAGVIRKMVHWVIVEKCFLNEVCRRLMTMDIPAPKGGKYWSRSTVGRILSNEALTGETYALKMTAVEAKDKVGSGKKTSRILKPKEEWVKLPDDTTPAIITKGEFEAIKRQLARNRSLNPGNRKYQYLLRSYIYCQDCGRKMYGIPVHGKRYYRCSGRVPLNTGKRCYSGSVNAVVIEDKAWQSISYALSNPDRLVLAYMNEDPERQFKILEKRKEKLKEELTTLDNAETKLIRLYEFTPMDDNKFKAEWHRNHTMRNQIQQQISEIEYSIQSYSQRVYSEDRIRELAGTLKEILDLTGKSYFKEKRQLFEDLHMKVFASDGQLQAVELALPAIESAKCDTVSSIM